jgi:hypothetical protein
MNWYTPKNLKTKFIAGFTFNEMCKYNLCPRYKQMFDINIQEDDILFINPDYIDSLVEFLNSKNIENKFTIITHNSDRDFTKQMFLSIEKFANKIYAINCTVSDPKIVKIPLGFNDQSTEFLDVQSLDFIEKSNLLYMNFNLNHHPSRRVCFNHFKMLDWVTVDSQCINNTKISFGEFYDKLKTFKYCLAPRGTGIDTHRLYESLLFGVIPIVEKSELDDLYEKFPILIVNDWSEVTPDFLIDNYDANILKYKTWLEENKDWFLPDYWIKK